MIIRQLEKIKNTELDVNWGNGLSRRLLLENDRMGYSITDTIVDPNSESLLEYKILTLNKDTNSLESMDPKSRRKMSQLPQHNPY